MSLDSANFSAGITFTESATVAGFGKAKHGPVSLQAAGNVPVADFDRVYAARINLAGGANTTIDLAALTDAFGVDFGLEAVRYIMLKSADGQPCTIEPGASNGLVWFFGAAGDKVVLKANGFFLLGDGGETVQAVGASAKTLKITNTGGAAGNFDLVVVGKEED